jgi:hypothetical protein
MKLIITALLIYYPVYLFIGVETSPNKYSANKTHYGRSVAMIKEGQSLLKEGDLVVRLNRDLSSQFIKKFNREDKAYSHAGIVLFENGYPYVFHLVNDEENPKGKFRKDSLSTFSEPRKNSAFGIFRYNLNAAELDSLKQIIYHWYSQGLCFDFAFNLDSDDRMYCSEMVSKALAQATKNRICIASSRLTTSEAALFSLYCHLPLKYSHNLKIIPIDNLYTNTNCHLVSKYNFDE